MNTPHFPAKKKESCDCTRNSQVTMPCQEHSFCLSFYYIPPQKTSILRASSPRSGAYRIEPLSHPKDTAQENSKWFPWAARMCDHGPL